MIQVFERYLIEGKITKENIKILKEKGFKVRKLKEKYYVSLPENLNII